ncbi:MAG: GGDEF domain-containing protein [Reyranella sp.]
MAVDVKTLFLINVAVLLLSASVSYYFWRQHRDNVGLLWWAFGTAICTPGILMLGIAGPQPPIPIGLASASLVIGGFAICWQSIRRFNGRRVMTGHIALIVLIFVSAIAVAAYRDTPISQRVALLFLGLSVCAGLGCWEVSRGYKQEPLNSRLIMAAILAVLATILALRATLTAFQPEGLTTETYYDPLHGIASIVVSISIFCLTMAMMMMANERVSTQYQKRALTDELTGLPNRRSFLEQAECFGKRPARNRPPASILMMDLDHFAQVNERLGHAGGDQALMMFAGLLRDHVRPTDIVARYGGEEFCAVLIGVDVPEATRIAERLRAAVAAQAFDVRGHDHRITVSIGVTAFRNGDLQASLRGADEALYRAKANGRNQVVNNVSARPGSSSVQDGQALEAGGAI